MVDFEKGGVFIILLAILVGFCVYTDLKAYKIYNQALLPGLIFGIIYQAVTSGLVGVFLGSLSMLIPFILLYPLFCIRVFGAGDIKLLCVAAMYMDPKQTIGFLITSFLAGAVLSILKMIRERNFTNRIQKFLIFLKNCFLCKKILIYEKEWTGCEEQTKSVIHFSIAIAMATVIKIVSYIV